MGGDKVLAFHLSSFTHAFLAATVSGLITILGFLVGLSLPGIRFSRTPMRRERVGIQVKMAFLIAAIAQGSIAASRMIDQFGPNRTFLFYFCVEGITGLGGCWSFCRGCEILGIGPWLVRAAGANRGDENVRPTTAVVLGQRSRSDARH
jgi:hypothetical protein